MGKTVRIGVSDVDVCPGLHFEVVESYLGFCVSGNLVCRDWLGVGLCFFAGGDFE